MEIQKVVVIQAVLTFLILSSSCLATQKMEYKGSPSPSPVKSKSESELDASFIRTACKRTYKEEFCYESLSPYTYDISRNLRSLCSSATWLALRALGVVSLRLSYDERFLPYDDVTACKRSVEGAESSIEKALKEGPEDNEYYGVLNRYDLAIGYVRGCVSSNSTADMVLATRDKAVMHLSNARDLCS